MQRPYSVLANERRAAERSLRTTDDPDAAFALVLRLDAISHELNAKIDASWQRAQAQPSAAAIRASIERGDWT